VRSSSRSNLKHKKTTKTKTHLKQKNQQTTILRNTKIQKHRANKIKTHQKNKTNAFETQQTQKCKTTKKQPAPLPAPKSKD